MIAPDSLHAWLAARVDQMVGRNGPQMPLVIWCDPQREWKQLLRLTAASALFDLWVDEVHELVLRERLRLSDSKPRVLWVPVTADAITYLEVYALQAASVWTTRLSQALSEYGVDLPFNDARDLEPLLASYAEERFDQPKAGWKDLTLGHAESTLVSATDVLEYLAEPKRKLEELDTGGRFQLFARIAARDFGLPAPVRGNPGQWRLQSLATLLCTEAASLNPQFPPAEAGRIIPDGAARENAMRLLKDWHRNVNWIESFESLVTEADRMTSLHFWAKDRPVDTSPLASRAAEDALFQAESDRLAAITEVGPLTRMLVERREGYQLHAAGFWGKLASHRIQWRELAQFAGNAAVLQEVAKTATEWHTPAEAVVWYTSEGWRADAAGEELFREMPELPGTLMAVRARLQRAFMRLLESVSASVSEALASKGFDLGLPSAGERLLPAVEGATARSPVAVLVLDAFRFELGRRLANLLNESEPAPRAEVVAARAPLPSMTAIGMAYCLPISSGRLKPKVVSGALAVNTDDFAGNLSISEQRREWLRQSFKIKSQAILSVDQVLSSTTEQLSVKSLGRLVFAFGDEVDSDGHDGRLQLMGNEFNLARYAQAIRKLRSAGYPLILITTDHGFFHWNPEVDQVDTKPEGERLWTSRRACVGRELSGGGALKTRMSGSDLECVIPRGINTFKTYGGVGYFHGGATLQELVIPVVTVSWPRKSRKVGAVLKPVDRIERLIQKIEVAPAGVQQDLTGGVDDNLVARAVFAKAVDATTGKTLFKSDAATLEPGGQSAALTLKRVEGAEGQRGLELRLHLIDADDDTVLETVPVKLSVDLDDWD